MVAIPKISGGTVSGPVVLADNSRTVLERRYLAKDSEGEIIETPEELFRRVAHNLAQAELNYGASQRQMAEVEEAFYQIMTQLDFLPNSPTLGNAGRPLQQLSACFVLPVPDSIEGIFETIKHTAMIHKSGGGCLRKGALVATQRGLLPIEQVRVGDTVYALDQRTNQATPAQVLQTHIYNVDDAYTVVLNGGRTLTTSAWHPFMVFNGQEVVAKRADELTSDDYVMTPSATAPTQPQDDVDWHWLIGFFIGNGHITTGHHVGFSVQTPDEEAAVRASLYKAFGRWYSTDRSGTVPIIRVQGKQEIAQFTRYFHAGPKSRVVSIPAIFHTPAVVAGLFDADGSVTKVKSGKQLRLCLETTSDQLANQVAGILNLWGITTRTHYHESGKQSRFGPSWIWRIQIVEAPSIRAFKSIVGPYLKRLKVPEPKSQWSNRISNMSPSVDHVNDGASRTYSWEDGRTQLSTTVAVRIATSPTVATAVEYSQKVVSVTQVEGGDDFYDLTVEGHETYAAGEYGLMFVHNTGFAFSRLRPEGSMVATSAGVASGPISFMKIFDAATEQIKQGGTRRGANMGVLAVDHPDIEKFIELKADMTTLTNFNISVAVTEVFMQAVERDEEYDIYDPYDHRVVGRKRARDVWSKLVQNAWKNGDPGLIFIDRVNETNPVPQWGRIESTNPCYKEGSLVATERGLVRIEDLKIGDRAYVGNGKFENIVKFYDVGERDVLKISGTGGYENIVTPDQEMWVPGRGIVLAKDLKVGDPLEIQADGYFPGGGDRKEGRLAGLICGDGSFSSKMLQVTFNPRDQEIADSEFVPAMQEAFGSTAVAFTRTQRSGNPVYRWNTGTVKAKEFCLRYCAKDRIAPDTLQQGRDFVRGFIEGLLFADGHIETGAGMHQVALTSKYRRFLQDVQTVLLQFGVTSSIFTVKRVGHPTDELYGFKGPGVSYRLQISGQSRDKFLTEFEILSPYMQSKLGPTRAGYRNKAVHVTSIEPAGTDHVYDFTTDGDRLVYVDGIRSRECGEQALGPYDSCNLGSINLANFAVRNGDSYDVDWDRLGYTVAIAVRLLDNVIDMNKYPIPEISEMSRQNRRIGLGVMGFADLLMTLGVPYDSDEAVDRAEELMRFIENHANAASLQLGEERGVFPAWEGSVYNTRPDVYPDKPRYRNCARTTVAPTGTLSIIANCSSGIEPVFALAFTRQHYLDRKESKKTTKMMEVNTQFLQIAQARGFYSDELMEFLTRGGRLADRVEVPSDVKAVFVTAHDIAPEWHVRSQAAFQRHVDNGVSKTINFPHDATPEDVHAAYMLAYQQGCKGITTYRDGSRDTQVLSHEPIAAVPSTGTSASEATAVVTDIPNVIITSSPEPHRRRLPDERQSLTHKFRVGDQEGYLTIGLYDDGSPGEVFIKASKQGSTVSGLMDTIAQLTSIALQYGVPLEAMASKLKGSWFEPSGLTDHPKLHAATSLTDYIFRYLEHKYLNDDEIIGEPTVPVVIAPASIEIQVIDVSPEYTRSGIGCPECGVLLHHSEGCLICRGCGYSKCG